MLWDICRRREIENLASLLFPFCFVCFNRIQMKVATFSFILFLTWCLLVTDFIQISTTPSPPSDPIAEDFFFSLISTISFSSYFYKHSIKYNLANNTLSVPIQQASRIADACVE